MQSMTKEKKKYLLSKLECSAMKRPKGKERGGGMMMMMMEVK